MPATPGPWSEDERVKALAAYDIVESPREPPYDSIARDAAECFSTTFAAVTFVGEENVWLKAWVGPLARTYLKDEAFCAHVVRTNHLLVVADALKDARFAAYPAVTGPKQVRFYAGVPVRTPAGIPIGTVCILDQQPRSAGLNEDERALLDVLAQKVAAQLELRRLDEVQEELGDCTSSLETASEGVEPSLSARQTEVLGWAAAGKSAGETATILGVSTRTVRFHLTSACERLGVSRTTQAVALALEHGLISLAAPQG